MTFGEPVGLPEGLRGRVYRVIGFQYGGPGRSGLWERVTLQISRSLASHRDNLHVALGPYRRHWVNR